MTLQELCTKLGGLDPVTGFYINAENKTIDLDTVLNR